MSFDDLHSSLSASNGQSTTVITDIELDAKFLNSLVGESEETHADDSELLTRLEGADTMAGGVEARLDEILGTLDDLLASLETNDTSKPQPGAIPPSESQPERPPSDQS